MFQGMTIRENVSAGILIVDQGLVIRRVSRQQSGRYSCTAVNSEGNGSSNTVLLKVMRKFNQWSQLVIRCFNFQTLYDFVDVQLTAGKFETNFRFFKLICIFMGRFHSFFYCLIVLSKFHRKSFECISIWVEIRSKIREKRWTPRDGADLRIELK
jgi:hypothetical protein